jgi:hypothetical protein
MKDNRCVNCASTLKGIGYWFSLSALLPWSSGTYCRIRPGQSSVHAVTGHTVLHPKHKTQDWKPRTRAPKTIGVQTGDKLLSYTENPSQTEPLPKIVGMSSPQSSPWRTASFLKRSSQTGSGSICVKSCQDISDDITSRRSIYRQ